MAGIFSFFSRRKKKHAESKENQETKEVKNTEATSEAASAEPEAAGENVPGVTAAEHAPVSQENAAHPETETPAALEPAAAEPAAEENVDEKTDKEAEPTAAAAQEPEVPAAAKPAAEVLTETTELKDPQPEAAPPAAADEVKKTAAAAAKPETPAAAATAAVKAASKEAPEPAPAPELQAEVPQKTEEKAAAQETAAEVQKNAVPAQPAAGREDKAAAAPAVKEAAPLPAAEKAAPAPAALLTKEEAAPAPQEAAPEPAPAAAEEKPVKSTKSKRAAKKKAKKAKEKQSAAAGNAAPAASDRLAKTSKKKSAAPASASPVEESAAAAQDKDKSASAEGAESAGAADDVKTASEVKPEPEIKPAAEADAEAAALTAEQAAAAADEGAASAEAEGAAQETSERKAERESFFSRLKKTRDNLAAGLSALLKGRVIDEDLYEDLETSLLMADLGVDTTNFVIEKLREEAKLRELHDASLLKKRLQQILTDLLKPCEQPLDVTTAHPFVILMVGVNGAGKTTTIGKLARKYKDQGLKVMLAAGDTFRAAAVEQLKEWGERAGVPVIAQATGSDSASVLFDALNAAKARGYDVLICDTAGRLQNKSQLMDELKKIVRVLKKIDPAVPHEVLLVLDASTGQNAVSQTKLFKEAAAVSGLCLTKLDGTAKGGVIFALADKFKLPLRYVGMGEKAEDLRPFKADLFVEALLREDHAKH